MNHFFFLLVSCMALGLQSCASLKTDDSSRVTSHEVDQGEIRSFATQDHSQVMRAVISIMQKMGYSVKSANQDLGTILGQKKTASDITIKVVISHNQEETISIYVVSCFKGKTYRNSTFYEEFFKEISQQVK